MSFKPAVGVVYLPDLLRRHVWVEDQLPAILASRGLALEPQEASSFSPPSELVVVCSPIHVKAMACFRGWLSEAEVLRVIVSFHEELELWNDLEVRELCQLEIDEALGSLTPAEVLVVRDVRNTDLLESALNRNQRSATPSLLPVLPRVEEQPAGPWCSLEASSCRDSETTWPSLVCIRSGVPSLYVPSRRAFLSLRDGTYGPTVREEEDTWVAVWPDGSKLLTSTFGGGPNVVRDLETGDHCESAGFYGGPINVWPASRVAWMGARCTFCWLHLTRDGQVSSLCACEHDWPCGHEKKQYGYLDNEPCWVHLSRRSDAYLSAYQKDAVVSSAIPVRWRRCGQGWAATSVSCSDPHRALFFVCEGEHGEADPTDPNECDARDARPAIALGPSLKARYALDLGRPVYRLTNDSSVLVHTPGPHYGVFDVRHNLLRLGSGRLLGGWDDKLTVLDHDLLFRDDTESGERRPLGQPRARVDWAFSVPGTPNVVLVEVGQPQLRVRLV